MYKDIKLIKYNTFKLIVFPWNPHLVQQLASFFASFLENMDFRMPFRILPTAYKRHVDDILVTIDTYLQLLKFVNYMNYHSPNIL